MRTDPARYLRHMRQNGLTASDIVGQLDKRQSAEPDVNGEGRRLLTFCGGGEILAQQLCGQLLAGL